MSAFPPDSDARDERAEGNDPVWKLLDRAPLPEPDAWFTVRTLARCRLEEPAELSLLERGWRWMLGAGLATCVAVLLAVHMHPAVPVATNQKGVQEAFEIMATMAPDSDAPASPDTTSWQDSSL